MASWLSDFMTGSGHSRNHRFHNIWLVNRFRFHWPNPPSKQAAPAGYMGRHLVHNIFATTIISIVLHTGNAMRLLIDTVKQLQNRLQLVPVFNISVCIYKSRCTIMDL